MKGKISPVRPKRIAPQYQILFTFLLIGIQIMLIVVSLSVVPPSVTNILQINEINQDDFQELIIQCTSPHIALIFLQTVYFTALTIANTILASLTTRFPQNFTESKQVVFAGSLMCSLILVLSFSTTNTVVLLLTQLSALAVLISLFGSRVFVMIVFPKRNVQTSTAVKISSTHPPEQSEKSITETEKK